MTRPAEVTIVLLGDPECGKSVFLSRLAQGPSFSPHHAVKDSVLPTPLSDLQQPFEYDISLFNRPYRFSFYDTASPSGYTTLRPDVVILCYDISSRSSLISIQEYWIKEASKHYTWKDQGVPIMLIGLKRDLRLDNGITVMPQEGYRIAQEMRCDRYAECSALTGELMDKTIEDIARLAARTTTANGALEEPTCSIM